MSQIKWGGPFTSVDKSTRTVISGDVWGTFDGEVSPQQEHSVKTVLVGALPVVFRESDISFLKLIAQLDVISDALQASVSGQLAELGVSGTVKVNTVQLDPESEAKAFAAMTQAGSSSAGESSGGDVQAELANQMAHRLAAAAQGGGLTRGKLMLLLAGVIGVIVLVVVASLILPWF